MKTLAVLTDLMMIVVSCGGADGLSTDTRTGTKGNTPVFEPPPAPGG